MKTVLLLTDLSVQSLSPVHDIVRNAQGGKVNIQVVHMLSLPSSITDLLFLEESKPYKNIPRNFIEAFQMLRNKHAASLGRFEFNFVYCSTSAYFNNFIEGHRISEVYMLDDYTYRLTLPQSQSFACLINKIKVPVTRLSAGSSSEYQILSSLLRNTHAPAPVVAKQHQTEMSYS